jgi:hypothetical protein
MKVAADGGLLPRRDGQAAGLNLIRADLRRVEDRIVSLTGEARALQERADAKEAELAVETRVAAMLRAQLDDEGGTSP